MGKKQTCRERLERSSGQKGSLTPPETQARANSETLLEFKIQMYLVALRSFSYMQNSSKFSFSLLFCYMYFLILFVIL